MSFILGVPGWNVGILAADTRVTLLRCTGASQIARGTVRTRG